MTFRQENATRSDTTRAKIAGQLLCSALSAAICIGIERDVHGALPVAHLSKLVRIQMRA